MTDTASPEDNLLFLLDDLQIPVVGPVLDGLGYDGGQVVSLTLINRKVALLADAGYRCCPTGDHTIIAPP